MPTDQHIRHSRPDRQGSSWCGRVLSVLASAFASVDHAAYNQLYGTVTVCPECLRSVVAVLTGLEVMGDDRCD